jgi:spectinomycin phosphotransferase
MIRRYDRLAGDLVADTSDAWVITQGEPHSSNFIIGRNGRCHLVDWDTVRLAPRERDVSAFGFAGPTVPVEYRSEAGCSAVRARVLELFRARWMLCEICEYADRFHRAHEDGPDERRAWDELVLNMPNETTWPGCGT